MVDDARVGCVSQADATSVTDVTVIVPTRNEAGNIRELVRRLDAALGATRAEVLFVDDSTDDTPRRIREEAARSVRPVHLLHRPARERVGGLGGAVVTGLRRARTEWAVVMDADLQHPPEVVPALVESAAGGAADVVVASRYCTGGSAEGLSSRSRTRVSRWTIALVRRMFPRPLGGCSDPMSGFFAVRRSALDLDGLEPIGFKILLEILVRTRGLRVAERPFAFGRRLSGESKASLREGMRFVRQLLRLRLAVTAAFRRRLLRIFGFGAVGATGIVVNTLALWLLVGVGLHYLVGAALATQVSTVWNFALTDTVVFRGAKRGWWPGRFVPFALMNNSALLLRLPLLGLLVDVLRMNYIAGNVLVLVVLFLVRFVVSDLLIYREGEPMTVMPHTGRGGDPSPVDLVVDLTEAPPAAETAGPSPRYLRHRYDIHGLVRIGSEVPLPELEYFRTPAMQSGYDLEIRRGRVGTGGLRRRAVVTQTTSPLGVRYEEHLGRLGADLQVHMGAPVEVVIGPLLARSPHVLYTNLVEPLLRFLLVSRGHVLLHAACLDMGGRGVLISARTDTGKTCTVLRLIRETGAAFLSDDMTVITAEGRPLCYPKPLTISHHTLRAVSVDELTRRERRRLRLQSRLHSKQGRAAGIRLAGMNLPIMALNAVTQWLVPPPKYDVDRLVPCQITTTAQVEELFVIERGAAALADVPPGQVVDRLVANTDDAYGFPPFGYLAPALVIGDDDYEQLRAKERSILHTAMSAVRARCLAADDFTWAEVILTLVPASALGQQRGPDGVSQHPQPAGKGR